MFRADRALTVGRRIPSPVGFRRHPWPFLSGFSLIGCFARLNVLERRDFLGGWWTELEINQRQRSLSGPQWADWVGEESLYGAFRLRPGEAKLAFAVQPWLPASLRRVTWDADRILRFCAECLQQGFHTELFQLPWWCLCPIHACTLQDQCPQCHTPVPMNLHLSMPFDPEDAFHCPQCQMDFANNRAIVMAQRGEAVRQWHLAVGAHFRWTQAVDRAFVLSPRLRAESRVTTQYLLDLLAATDVAWPPELEPHVAKLGKATNLGIERAFGPSNGAVPLPPEFPRLAELEIELGQNDDDRSIQVCQSQCFRTTWSQAQVIVRLERRLSRESGQTLPPAFWDWLHKYRQRGERTARDPVLGQLQMDAPGFRDRGYRYREQVMQVGTSTAGNTELTIIGSGKRCARRTGVPSCWLWQREIHVLQALVRCTCQRPPRRRSSHYAVTATSRATQPM